MWIYNRSKTADPRYNQIVHIYSSADKRNLCGNKSGYAFKFTDEFELCVKCESVRDLFLAELHHRMRIKTRKRKVAQTSTK